MAGLGFPPFGVPPFGAPRFNAILFDTLPIGARIIIGTDASTWVGNFGGVIDGVVFVTNARLFSNIGNPVDGLLSVVRIPVRQISYVSY
ncbi:hypothetical protein [Desulfosporosinus sp. FKB]|uniref:hypothetical protein n=1 Tax=Desulfosporosinus sp. FKB TaxID=1969835 RepID=UPI000B498C04|nr:hypothetical protein [Desulfosporosinus sp. FKB]